MDLDEIIPEMGTMSDAELARRTEIPYHHINIRRRALGIPRYNPLAAIKWDEVGLGDVSDEDLAEKLGCGASRVQNERQSRRIWTYKRRSRTVDWDEQPLGEIPDLRIAQELDIAVVQVWRARRARNIPPTPASRRRGVSNRNRIDWDEQPLGEVPDRDLAFELGVRQPTVARQRTQRGLPPKPHPVREEPVDWDEVEDLGVVSDLEIAVCLGVSSDTVRGARAARNIALSEHVHPPLNWRKYDRYLGKRSDQSVAKLIGCSTTAVALRRRRKGIPAFVRA